MKNRKSSDAVSDYKKILLGDDAPLKSGAQTAGGSGDLSLEAILAEFSGGKNAAQGKAAPRADAPETKPAAEPAPVKPLNAAEPAPVRETENNSAPIPKPTPAAPAKPEPSAPKTEPERGPAVPAEPGSAPAPKTEPEPATAPKAEPERAPVPKKDEEPEPTRLIDINALDTARKNGAQAPAAEPEKAPAKTVPNAPVPSREEISVTPPADDGPVIDLAVFDRVYEKKRKKIKLLKKQLISYEKSKRKADLKILRSRKLSSLKAATLITAPIPIPSGAKAELDSERAAKPEGRRFERASSKAAKKAAAEEQKPKKPPINPYTMMRRIERLRRSLTARTWIAFVLCLPLVYITIAKGAGAAVPDIVNFSANPFTYTLISLGLLILVIAVGYDVYFGGCYDLLTLRASGDSLVFCSTVASLGHCVFAIIDSRCITDASGNPAYAPVCVLPALAIAFSMLGDRIRYKSYSRSLRSAHRLTHSKVLTVLPEKYDGDVIYAAANSENLQGFFHSMRENDATSSTLRWLSPVIIVASLALAFYASISGPTGAPFFWCWSVTSAFTPALGFFLAATLPLSAVSKRMYKNGVLIGGGKAISRLGGRSFVLLSDGDVFPGEAISINGYKLLDQDEKEFAISMTASVLDAACTSLAKPFLKLAAENYAPIRPVSDLCISDSGGISGEVDGHNVMVGTGSYIQRCGIKIPPDIKLRTAVFCAVDAELLIIYAVRYQVMPRNDYAMTLLEDNGYSPIIASRDFNVTATFIQNRFGIPSSDLVYPPADLRTSMSDPSLTLDADGVLISRGCCGEAIAESLVACHRYKTVTRLALIFSALSSIIGLGLGALMAYKGWAEAASPVNMLLYYLLWLLPVLLFSGWVNKF